MRAGGSKDAMTLVTLNWRLREIQWSSGERGLNYMHRSTRQYTREKGIHVGATAKRLKDLPTQRSRQEELADKVSAVIEVQVKKMTPEQVRRADAALHKIVTRVRAASEKR